MPRTFEHNRTTYILGQDALDNWAIIADADKSWWWVHLSDVPSAHVIIQIDVPPLPEELEYARQLILAQTPKAPRHAQIVHAEVRRLRRGSKPGEVIIKSH